MENSLPHHFCMKIFKSKRNWTLYLKNASIYTHFFIWILFVANNILVKILSTSGIVAEVAGTQQPRWARYTIRPTCFMYTLLPLELGPDRRCTLPPSSPMLVSFGMNGVIVCSCNGCRPLTISKKISMV